MSIATNTGLLFINTQTRPGTLVIPDIYTLPGRVITFKDTVGSFQFSTLTLATQSTQVIDNQIISSIQTTRFGWTTLTGGPNNSWFVTGGTQLNSLTTSTFTTDYLSTNRLELSNIIVSSIQFLDRRQAIGISSVSSILFTSSAYLWYSTSTGSTILTGGPRLSFGTQILRVRA